MEQLSVFIKLLHQCNLRCTYCYEQEHAKDHRILTLQEMNFILRRVRAYAQKQQATEVSICYTGGEIMILGMPYLASLFALTRKTFRGTGIKLDLSIQTNLTLLNDEYIRLFKKYRIWVGFSFDVYGGQRIFPDGKTADQIVKKNIGLLLRSRLRISAIAAITRNNYRRAKEIFEFFDRRSIPFHVNRLFPWSYRFCPELTISDRQYINFLKDISAIYLSRRKPKGRMAIIDSYLELLQNGPGHNSICEFSRDCIGDYIFIENNGDIYPCDNLFHKEFILGNIFDRTLSEILNSPVLKRLRKRPWSIERQCQGCEYLEICNGGCLACAYMEDDILKRSKSYCRVNRTMFKYLGRRLKKLGQTCHLS